MRLPCIWARGVRALILISIAMVQSGCVDIQGPVPAPVETKDVFSELYFTTDAMFIAEGQTLPLTLRAIAADDSPIPVEMPNVTWVLSDSVRLNVDSLGRITGKMRSNVPMTVQAKYTHGSTSRTATISVNVTAAQEFSATAVKLVALDSTRVGAGFATPWWPRIRADLLEGTSVVRTGVQLPLTAPPTLLTLTFVPTGGPQGEPVYFVGNRGTLLGTAWVKASVDLYGTEVADSIELQGLYPFIGPMLSVAPNADGTFPPVDHTIRQMQPCAPIQIITNTTQPYEIVFSDSAASPDGCRPMDVSRFREIFPFVGTGTGFFNEVIMVGGNMLLPAGRTAGIRRSNTRGKVSWYLRDAVTKERIPDVEGTFMSISVEEGNNP